MSDEPSLFVVSAATTDEGAPVYLSKDGSWTRDLQAADPVDAETSERLVRERSEQDQRAVCDPYAFKVGVEGRKIDPLTVREAIRAEGPTTRLRRPD
jgi:hypothetical protein